VIGALAPAAAVYGRYLLQAVWTLGFARRLYPRLEMAPHILPSKTIKLVDIYEPGQYHGYWARAYSIW
jgi:hypothetical protein